MSDYFKRVQDAVTFMAGQATKADLVAGTRLFAGLNCFEPGQSQRAHTHAGADKFYFLVSGKARIRVGEEIREARAGELVWAPAGLEHGVVEALEQTVMLVAMAPPPGGHARDG
jgi:quercetin dioxygenase-like cupin family protein